MCKRIKLVSGTTIVILLLLATTVAVLAADPVVTITVRKFVCGAPTDFTVTYVSDYEVLIEWTKGVGANNTMVRRAVGRIPANREDGELVYYGTGTSVSDYDVYLEYTDASFCYRGWSQAENEMWETTGASDCIKGGSVMILLGLFLLCGIVSYLSMRSNFMLLKLMAGVGWVAMFIYWMYNPPSVIGAGSPPHIAVMLLFIGMAVAIPLAGLGREITRQSDWRSGLNTESSSSFKFHLPEWLKAPSAEESARISAEQRRAEVEAYRMRLHRALNPNEFRRRERA